VLLKEIHHRVKNNLQVISSLLSLQAMNVQDQTLLEMLRDSENRVRSMALVHERLYRSQDLAHVDFAEYVQGLTSHLFRSYRLDGRGIRLTVDIADVPLTVDVAVPCGLILNELVSNALKHAFPNGHGGEIRVELHEEDEGRVALMVKDDGVGFPADVDFRHTESLGLQLVNTLARQLQGTVELERQSGTAFRICFAQSA
jgi:two-component sensor histidine kinase